jgi:hypothetical protein
MKLLRITTMSLPWKAGCWLGLIGLACISSPTRALGDNCPLKIDVGVKAWFHVDSTYQQMLQNVAPWYTYFPYDPAVMGAPLGNTYPTWPSSSPPPPNLPAPRPAAASTGASPTYLPALTPDRQSPTSQRTGPGPVQAVPVSFGTSPVPSYWFPR